MTSREKGPRDFLTAGTWQSGATFTHDLSGRAARDAWRIAQGLRLQRTARGLTQGEIAQRAGVTARSVRDLELGTVWPSLRTVTAIAAALGVHVGVVRPKPKT
jgi:DNA-binding XRE family transcriptional regulator